MSRSNRSTDRRRPPLDSGRSVAVTWRQVLGLRLARHGLLERAPAGGGSVVELVGRLVGLHAQVMSAAELQAAVRIDELRPSDVRDALWEERRLVKVWAFRQTLHLLTPDDLATFVVAARSLERWHTPAWLRYFGMTEAGIEEVIDAIGDVLSDRPMTRVEIVEAVVERVRRPHLRESMLTGWGTFLGPAAQRGKLVFGPSAGRNVAFVDPSDWLDRPIRPSPDPDAADDALAGLIARYLAVFPGASREMIARWWGGGRMTAVTRALARMPSEIAQVDVEGTRGLVLAEDLAPLVASEPGEHAVLLPGFDPFTNELPRHAESVLAEADHDKVHRTAGWVSQVVVLDGRVGGTWTIEDRPKGAGRVVVQPFARWRSSARRELRDAVERVAAFLDRPLSLEIGARRRAR